MIPPHCILIGDALEQLRTLPDASVHCVVTSPPYWCLRDYGTGTWEGGDPGCAHRFNKGGTSKSGLGNYDNGLTQATIARKVETYGHATYRSHCKRCGARRVDAQLGLEDTPERYIERMTEVFREVRRVLRDDGTLWLNIGDSYAGQQGGGQGPTGARADRSFTASVPSKSGANLKPKDMVGIPWMLAFALRADGWFLRSEIIWHKPSPMPESVRDRPTTAHERIFLLAKSTAYYYDADAIKEAVTGGAHARRTGVNAKAATNASGSRQNASFSASVRGLVEKRNKRTVWTVPSQPFAGAHFATFPPALVEPCILAGSPRGGVVLDPFGGAMTTALVALRLGREALAIELNPEYARMGEERLQRDLVRPRRQTKRKRKGPQLELLPWSRGAA